MVKVLNSKHLFLLKLVRYISVEGRKNLRNIFVELKQVEEISITGRSFVCLFYAHFRVDTIFQQALLFTHQMAIFS